jgi:hypothetical protein
LDIILLFHELSYGGRVTIALFPALKLARVPSMFGMSLPDAIDVTYVLFYYRFVPTLMFVCWCLVFLHTLVMIKLLISSSAEESYHAAITWVWILISSAPLDSIITNQGERVYSGFLMTLSVIVQGYVVGDISLLVSRFNVRDDNRTQMLVTLEMLKRYKLPKSVLHDVLSFQSHVLEDNHRQNFSSMSHLPPSVVGQIEMYLKVQVLTNNTFFDKAPGRCKTELAKVMTSRVVEPDRDIMVAGEVGNTMYFLLHGLADVILTDSTCVATLRRGDFFGEIALLAHDTPRKATVSTLTYCDLLELKRIHFDHVIKQHPEYMEHISKRRETEVQQQRLTSPSDELLFHASFLGSSLSNDFDVASTHGAIHKNKRLTFDWTGSFPDTIDIEEDTGSPPMSPKLMKLKSMDDLNNDLGDEFENDPPDNDDPKNGTSVDKQGFANAGNPDSYESLFDAPVMDQAPSCVHCASFNERATVLENVINEILLILRPRIRVTV